MEMSNINSTNTNSQHINILLVCITCYGFGDIIAADKVRGILENNYPDVTVKIATNRAYDLANLGCPASSIIELVPKKISNDMECLRFSDFEELNFEVDLYFVVPLTSLDRPSLASFRKLVPCADEFNTAFFSEYNHPEPHKFDFPLGFGDEDLGLLFRPAQIDETAITKFRLQQEYFLAYAADMTNASSRNCVLNFINMIIQKYSGKLPVIEIIIPESFIETLKQNAVMFDCKEILFVSHDLVSRYRDVYSYFPNTVIFRGDILPTANNDFINLAYYSQPDILISGDQSLSDVIYNCPDKNIWYQIHPWKRNLAKDLADWTDKICLNKPSTSCGCDDYFICNTSNITPIIQELNFEVLAKPLLDDVIASAITRKNMLKELIY